MSQPPQSRNRTILLTTHFLDEIDLLCDTVGILFGRERSGLENDEVALADSILTLPVNPAFASLNLAQAVIIVAYEWFKHSTSGTHVLIWIVSSCVCG